MFNAYSLALPSGSFPVCFTDPTFSVGGNEDQSESGAWKGAVDAHQRGSE